MLHVNKQRAVALLSQGHDTSSVARIIGYTRQTVCRWRDEPEFQAELERQVSDIMGNMHVQVQTTARGLIEGGMETVQSLRCMLTDTTAKHQDRRLSGQCILKHATRFWDLLGYNAKAKAPRKLMCDENGKPIWVEQNREIPDPNPGDRHTRSDAERDPAQGHYDAKMNPPWVTDWEYNPVHDDGTLKGPPDYFHREAMLAAVPNDEIHHFADTIHQGDLNTEADVQKILLQIEALKKAEQSEPPKEDLKKEDPPEPEVQTVSATHKPQPMQKPKAWKRSATTLRCKPDQTPTPIADGTQRNISNAPAALNADDSDDATPTQDAHGPG